MQVPNPAFEEFLISDRDNLDEQADVSKQSRSLTGPSRLHLSTRQPQRRIGALELEETYLQLSSDGVNVLTPCLVSYELFSVLVAVITPKQLSLKVNPLTGKLDKHRALLF